MESILISTQSTHLPLLLLLTAAQAGPSVTQPDQHKIQWTRGALIGSGSFGKVFDLTRALGTQPLLTVLVSHW